MSDRIFFYYFILFFSYFISLFRYFIFYLDTIKLSSITYIEVIKYNVFTFKESFKSKDLSKLRANTRLI